jgi:glucose/arabinose dehydrogenase
MKCSTLGYALVLGVVACEDPTAPAENVQCDTDNGGITLPAGFCAVVVADLTVGGSAADARHMAVTPNGDVFVAINAGSNIQPAFGIIGLRDTDGDGRADEESEFSPDLGGSGIAWNNGVLYFGANDRVLRFTLPNGQLTPTGAAQIVVSGLPNTEDHISKTLVFGNSTTLFVNIGSASNACQVNNRQAQSPGVFPCAELPTPGSVDVQPDRDEPDAIERHALRDGTAQHGCAGDQSGER